jgi:hypothetical protein
MAKKYILVVGCYRSGTTALFNLVRLVLKHTGKDYDGYFWGGKTMSNKEYQLVKTHTYSKAFAKKAYKIFIAYRKLSEIKKSMSALKNVGDRYANAANLEYLETAQGFAKQWLAEADYIQHFDTLVNMPLLIIGDIYEELNIKYDTKQAMKILKEFRSLKAPKKGHNEETLLTETHKKYQ